jgi:hypothetical protein
MTRVNSKRHIRAIVIPLAVVLLAVSLSGAEKPPKAPKAPPAPKAHPNTGPGGGPPAPKRAIDEQIQKLAQMSPAQREKALANLPPARRERVEAGIARWNKISPQLKAEQEKFRSLPPETQKRIRQLSQRIRSLPPERKAAVTQELNRLRNMPEAQRQKRLNSPAVKNNFSPDEQEILRETPGLLPQSFY